MWFYGFMEKPGIEPATPGLQGIALIHYTMGAFDWEPCHLVVSSFGALSYWQRFLVAKFKKTKAS